MSSTSNSFDLPASEAGADAKKVREYKVIALVALAHFVSSWWLLFTCFIALNLMLSWLIVQPIRAMSMAADKISTGDFNVPEFGEKGRDEMSVLGSSFNRMRRSLEKAMQMIDG